MCQEYYIGETGVPVGQRIAGHMNDATSKIKQHLVDHPDHAFHYRNADMVRGKTRRLIAEQVHAKHGVLDTRHMLNMPEAWRYYPLW
jgi:hypothetical protein